MMSEYGTAFAVMCTGAFVLLMGIAANIAEVTSIFFIDFSKDLSTVGSPTVAVGEVGVSLIAIGFLVMGVLFLDNS